ncbi:hypothetical protein KBK19_07725 [Microvirga sp. STR05]|uniref:DUF4129 domain-containing protein n=1 Tax=Hymenobacter duratus TaxID=2771356 RepID=A0ABR8JDK1_9BACT|nr:hypothetical protein [Hymenobacter duratus]MBD2714919.1 hypothetical protein [Hymenobacter duratus]MBR7949825.1 hypothetical protein [Microvirga sp. STR05]
MAASSSPESEFFTQKTDAELLFLAQHPELYHPDLVSTARRELRRRGLNPDPEVEPQPMGAHLPPYDDSEEPMWWQRPGVWVTVLAVLLLGSGLYWKSLRGNKTRQDELAQQAKDAPAVLKTVETHLIPSFDSLTRTQIAQEMRQLPASERTLDTTATRKYRLLAERYWKAENQTLYLLDRVRQTAPDSALPGQTVTVVEEWRRLTKALVYDHGLTPVLAKRMDVMRRGAYLRIELLQSIKGRFEDGQPVYNEYLTTLRDSATTMHEALLSREKWAAGLRRGTSL